jgi:hypothetical protein
MNLNNTIKGFVFSIAFLMLCLTSFGQEKESIVCEKNGVKYHVEYFTWFDENDNFYLKINPSGSLIGVKGLKLTNIRCGDCGRSAQYPNKNISYERTGDAVCLYTANKCHHRHVKYSVSIWWEE